MNKVQNKVYDIFRHDNFIYNVVTILKESILDYENFKLEFNKKSQKNSAVDFYTTVSNKDYTFDLIHDIITFCINIFGLEFLITSEMLLNSSTILTEDIIYLVGKKHNNIQNHFRITGFDIYDKNTNNDNIKFSNIKFDSVKCYQSLFDMCICLYYLSHVIPDYHELYKTLKNVFKGTILFVTFKQKMNILKEQLFTETKKRNSFLHIFQNSYFCACYLKKML